jgi:hypothetical protein
MAFFVVLFLMTNKIDMTGRFPQKLITEQKEKTFLRFYCNKTFFFAMFSNISLHFTSIRFPNHSVQLFRTQIFFISKFTKKLSRNEKLLWKVMIIKNENGTLVIDNLIASLFMDALIGFSYIPEKTNSF